MNRLAEASQKSLIFPDRALAVLRRSEQTRLSSASDDEVGELEGAIRAERAKAERSNQT